MVKGKGSTVSAEEQAELNRLVHEDETPQVAPDRLAVIVSKTHEMQQKRQQLTKVQQEAERLTKEIEVLEYGVLPTLLDEAGLRGLPLDDGWSLERTEDVFASISKENMPAACLWFDKNDYGDMVKAFYIIAVPKGEKAAKMSAEIRKRLEKVKVPFTYDANVHWQTLKAWAKEALKDAVKLPDIIKIHQKPRAKLIEPKQPKGR